LQGLCCISEDFFHRFKFKFGGLGNLGAIYAMPPRTYRAWVVVFVDFWDRRHHDDGDRGWGFA